MVVRVDTKNNQDRAHSVDISAKPGEADTSIAIANRTVIGIMKGCPIQIRSDVHFLLLPIDTRNYRTCFLNVWRLRCEAGFVVPS